MSDVGPRCLVLTLFSGENEFGRSQEALRAQSYARWERRIFERLPAKRAHDALYGEIMARRDEFDLFVKLDADMVFTGPDVLGSMVRMFRDDPGLDHAVFELVDFMSDGPLMGLHVFSNRVRWRRSSERLFVDPDPIVPGRRRLVREAPAPVARHAPDPSPYQAFHFGVHRGLKAFQPERDGVDPEQAYKQWGLLKRVWRHFERRRDARLGLAVLGADRIWSGALGPGGEDYDDAETRRLFERHVGRDASDLYADLARRWRPGPRRALRWARTGGLQMVRGGLHRLAPRARTRPEA
jgi:hypothetical protein